MSVRTSIGHLVIACVGSLVAAICRADAAAGTTVAGPNTADPAAASPTTTTTTDYGFCTVCHGVKGEGNSALHAPALAGQTDWYLVTELQDFQAGLRGFSPQDDSGTQMRAAASALSDEPAIKDVVAYINTLPRR
jgi:cytochrome c553